MLASTSVPLICQCTLKVSKEKCLPVCSEINGTTKTLGGRPQIYRNSNFTSLIYFFVFVSSKFQLLSFHFYLVSFLANAGNHLSLFS